MKSLAVIVTTAPNNHLTETAYQIIWQAVSQGINVKGVFFYQAGVLNASKYLTLPNDEYPLQQRWSELQKTKHVPLYLCSTAAEKHGLLDEEHLTEQGLIDPCFTLSGLGELVELHTQADRVVQL